jgi:hypothetical protein
MPLPDYGQRMLLRNPFASFEEPFQANADLFVTQPDDSDRYYVYDATNDYAGDVYNAGGLILPPYAIPIESQFDVDPSNILDDYWKGKTYTNSLPAAISRSTVVIDDSGVEIDDVVESELSSAQIVITRDSGGTITAISNEMTASSKLLVPTNTKPFRLFCTKRKRAATDIVRPVVAFWSYTASKSEIASAPPPYTFTFSYSTPIPGSLILPFGGVKANAIYILSLSNSSYWNRDDLPTLSGSASGAGTSSLFGHVASSSFAWEYVNTVEERAGFSEDTDTSPIYAVIAWDGSVPDLIPDFNCTIRDDFDIRLISASCSFSAVLFELLPDWQG